MTVGSRVLPTLLGAIGIVLWASETTLITFTTAIPPLQTVAIAFAAAALLSPIVWRVTGADPLAAFRQPPKVWAVTVVSLVGYHACIYYATQLAPPAPAALLQGTTPLMIVLASAFLPGERLRWWHVVGALVGLAGVLLLVEEGGEAAATGADAVFYLALIGLAAALWGLYSVVSRLLPDVPSSALGVFYAASSLIAFGGHLGLETWVSPTLTEWLAMAALGILPMGLAIFLWDYGVKRGDIQALGAISYVEPFIGAVLVALFTSGVLDWTLLWSGCLVIGGAVLASASLFIRTPAAATVGAPEPLPALPANPAEAAAAAQTELLALGRELLSMHAAVRQDDTDAARLKSAMSQLLALWDEAERIRNPHRRQGTKAA